MEDWGILAALGLLALPLMLRVRGGPANPVDTRGSLAALGLLALDLILRVRGGPAYPHPREVYRGSLAARGLPPALLWYYVRLWGVRLTIANRLSKGGGEIALPTSFQSVDEDCLKTVLLLL